MAVHQELVEAPASQSFRLLRWEGSLREVTVCVGPGEAVPIDGSGGRWHAHRAIELTFVERGDGVRFVGDHLGPIEPPELVLLGPLLPHYWSGLNRSAGVAAQLDLSAAGTLAGLPELATLGPLWRRAGRGLLYPRAVAVEVGARLGRMADQEPLARVAELLQTLLMLRDVRGDRGPRPLCEAAFKLSATAPHADAISAAVGLLVDHFREPLTIDDVAASVGISRATLSRYFRRYTGRSVITFLNGVRVDHARRRLVGSTEPISRIAFDAGFGNLSHFNRRFRLAMGESPSAYRRRHGRGAVG